MQLEWLLLIMGNRLILFVFANCLLFGVRVLHANAFRVLDHDLEVAASGKHEEWEKGDEEDYYGENDEEKGGKGEKGYESKHG